MSRLWLRRLIGNDVIVRVVIVRDQSAAIIDVTSHLDLVCVNLVVGNNVSITVDLNDGLVS